MNYPIAMAYGEMISELSKLIQRARELPPMTADEREEQSLCFAYGNLACTTNHKPHKSAFASLALDMGWSEERFAAWAADKEWWG